jgi:hypothetical protein
MNTRDRRVKSCLVAILSLLVTGCQSGKVDPGTAAATAIDAVIGQNFKLAGRDNVKLYRSGPQQLAAPDALLKKGTVVRVVRKEFGYSLVQSDAGQLGWVASEDLRDPSAEDYFDPATDSGGQLAATDNGLELAASESAPGSEADDPTAKVEF